MGKITKEYVEHLLRRKTFQHIGDIYVYKFGDRYVKIYKNSTLYIGSENTEKYGAVYEVVKLGSKILIYFGGKTFTVKSVDPKQEEYKSNEVLRKIVVTLKGKESTLQEINNFVAK